MSHGGYRRSRLGIALTTLVAVIATVTALPVGATPSPRVYLTPSYLSATANSLYAQPGETLMVKIVQRTANFTPCDTATSSTLTADFSTPNIAPVVINETDGTLTHTQFTVTVPATAVIGDRVTIRYECDGASGPNAPAPDLLAYPFVVTVASGQSVLWSSSSTPGGPVTVTWASGECVGPRDSSGASILGTSFSFDTTNPASHVTVAEVPGTADGVHTVTVNPSPIRWVTSGVVQVRLNCTIPGPPQPMHQSFGPVAIHIGGVGGGPSPQVQVTPAGGGPGAAATASGAGCYLGTMTVGFTDSAHNSTVLGHVPVGSNARWTLPFTVPLTASPGLGEVTGTCQDSQTGVVSPPWEPAGFLVGPPTPAAPITGAQPATPIATSPTFTG